MKSADALDRDDLPGSNEGCGGLYRVTISGNVRERAARAFKPNLRAAFGAGIGLRVEAAAGGIAVFRKAGRAHRELRHARGGAVVGDRADNRKPWPAIRAIGEGIAVATVGGVADIREAGGAGCGVGGDAGSDRAALAFDDPEAGAIEGGFERRAFDGVDAGQGRRFG